MKNSNYIGTYRASLSALVAAAGTAPFFILSGAANKKLRIKKISISGFTLTAVGYLNVAATKYSTAPTGGTPSAATKVPTSSRFPASSATLCQGYTAAPTAGSSVGEIAAVRVLGQATTAAAAGKVDSVILDGEFENVDLLSAAENIGLRFTGAPATAVTVSITVEWEEYNA